MTLDYSSSPRGLKSCAAAHVHQNTPAKLRPPRSTCLHSGASVTCLSGLGSERAVPQSSVASARARSTSRHTRSRSRRAAFNRAVKVGCPAPLSFAGSWVSSWLDGGRQRRAIFRVTPYYVSDKCRCCSASVSYKDLERAAAMNDDRLFFLATHLKLE